MGILVNIEDFDQGLYRFDFNDFNESAFEELMNVSEKLWIKTIMGEKLGDEFILDPTEPRWNKIKEPFIHHVKHCYGLKACLLAFVYSDLIKSDGIYSANSAQKVKSEVMQSVDIQMNFARAYNNGVLQAKMIRRKLHLHRHEDYLNYEHHCHRELLLTQIF